MVGLTLHWLSLVCSWPSQKPCGRRLEEVRLER